MLRPVDDADLPMLARILREPSVARWWSGDPEMSARDLLAVEDGLGFVIVADEAVVGAIQFAEENEPDYRHASLDLFLDTAHQGQGLGSDALRTMAHYLLDARGHHRLTIDPAVANERAIRAYERVGFRRVGVMRQYERGVDGSWHDGLLMDMLADELR